MYLLLLAVIYLSFIGLGLPDSLLGSGWPVMHSFFDVPVSYMGFVSMIISGGTIISSLSSERLNKRLGTPIVTLISTFLTAAALFGFSTCKEFYQICLWGIPYGLGAGAIDAALNDYVSRNYSSRHMSWLHCFWGVGTIISPYIMSFALAHSVWSDGYRRVSYIQFGIVLVLLLALPLWSVNRSASDEVSAKEVVGIRGVMKIKGVPQLLIGFFCYCAAESTAMLWTSSYLVGVRNISEKTAAAFASLFFIGMTSGRFVSGLVSDRLGDRNMIRIGAAVAVSGALCVMLPISSDAAALTGFVVIGVGCAPIYPSIIHSTPHTFGEENSSAIIGIQMASAYVGSTFMPPVFGLIAENFSISLMPLYLISFIAVSFFLLETAYKKSGK